MSSFFIKKELKYGVETYILTNNSKNWSVEIIPSLGARINCFEIDLNGKRHSIIKGFKGVHELKSTSVSGYYGAHLFPFPNRVRDGKYTHNGVHYKLPINETGRNNALHGLLHDQPFQFVSKQLLKDSANITFQYTRKTGFKGYPFSFILEISYSLDDFGLHLETTVKNTGTKPFPVGYGWHPYLDLGVLVDQLELSVPSTQFLTLDDRLIPTGKLKKFERFTTKELIKETVFDTCFAIAPTLQKAGTCLTNSTQNIEIVIYQKSHEQGLNYVQLFTPETRDCIAIEPMSCAPDALNTSASDLILGSKESRTWQCGLEIGQTKKAPNLH